MMGDMGDYTDETPCISTYYPTTTAGTTSSMFYCQPTNTTGTMLDSFLQERWIGLANRRQTEAMESLKSQITNTQPQQQKQQAMNKKRIVQVYVADTDDNVPVENSLLYQGEEKLTDLTDSELFFEIPIADLLKKHNDMRVTLLAKTKCADDKQRHLDPIRIRDLRMVVVTKAEF